MRNIHRSILPTPMGNFLIDIDHEGQELLGFRIHPILWGVVLPPEPMQTYDQKEVALLENDIRGILKDNF
ncbi:hypothetical protein N9955_00530 [bacterium]|nr:hypothetical protein [bacterium]